MTLVDNTNINQSLDADISGLKTKQQLQLQEALKIQHEEWLRHPVTTTVLRALKNNREKFVSIISSGATDNNKTDQQIRYSCVSLRRIEDVISIITDFQILQLKLNNENKT